MKASAGLGSTVLTETSCCYETVAKHDWMMSLVSTIHHIDGFCLLDALASANDPVAFN